MTQPSNTFDSPDMSILVMNPEEPKRQFPKQLLAKKVL